MEKRRQSENALQLSGEKTRLLIESAKDYAIFTLDTDRNVISWSRGAQLMFGYTEEEIIGKSGDIVFLPGDREKKIPEGEAQTAIKTGRSESQHWLLRKDGTRFWGSGSTHPLYQGETLIGFVKIKQDMTIAKQLEDAKFFLAAIVETSNDSIITIDFKKNITSWNKAAEYLYGYTAEEAIGKKLDMLTLPEDFVMILDKVDAVAHKREVVVFDSVRHKKGGVPIELEIVMSPVLNSAGELIGISTVARDISERKRREANLAFLAKINLGFSPLLNVQEVMEPVTEQLADYLQLSRSRFSLVDEEADRIEVIHEWSHNGSLSVSKSVEQLSDKFTEEDRRHLGEGKLVIINASTNSPLVKNSVVRSKQPGVGSLVYMPYLEGVRWKFLVTVEREEGSGWRSDELDLLQELAGKIYIRIERAHAEEKLRKSEEKYRTLFESIDEGVAILEVLFGGEHKAIDYRFVEINPSHKALMGVGPDVLGKRVREVMPTIEETIIEKVGQVVLTGQPLRYQEFVSPLGRWFDVFVSRVGGEGSYTAVSVFHDITEIKKAEERQRYLLELTEALRPVLNADEAQFAIVSLLGKHLGVGRAYYCEMAPDGDHMWIRRNYTNGVESQEGYSRITDFGPFLLEEYLKGRTVVMQDAETDERLSEQERVLYRAQNVSAFVCVPLVKKGKLISVLSINQPTPRKWTEAELAIIEETAERTRAAVEKAKAEEALRKSEAKFRRISDSGILAVAFFDINGSIVEANEAFLTMLGVDREELEKGKVRWDVYTPGEWMPRTIEAIEEFKRTGYISPYEKQFYHSSGELRWGLFSGATLEEGNSGVSLVIDITQRKVAEEALNKSEERLRTLANAVPQVIWTNNADGKANYFNERWYQYTGLSYEQSEGLGWQAIVHPDDEAVSVKKWKMALAAGEAFETEFRLRRYDGSYYWFICRNVPLRENSGRITSWFGSATDIQNLKHTEEALSQSEARLRITLESATDYAIITMDKDRKVERWSQGAYEILGFSEEEIIGESADIIFTPEDRKAGAPQIEIETARDKGRAADERWHQRKDGSRFFASGVLRPIQDGRHTGYVKVMRDITQQQLFTEELHHLVAERTIELQRSNEDLQQFASIASHDLQEPLRKLKLFSSVLQKFQKELPAEGKELLFKISLTSDRMSQLIREVLLFSKIAYGTKEFVLTDLDQVLHNVLNDLDMLLIETKAIVNCYNKLPQIEAAPSQMNQLFYNLVTNALKFRRKDSNPIINISVQPFAREHIQNYPNLYQDKNYIKIVVSDNGIGFEQEYAEQIFQIFERLHSSEEFEGTGVGLALCKKIIENHSGHIYGVSEEGQGATFHILLPLKQ